jgi:dihydrofolate reductase
MPKRFLQFVYMAVSQVGLRYVNGRIMNIIVAVDKNWAIGFQNKLLISIPEDMRFFRDETTHKVVVMGKNTLESFPGGRPLRDRTNIVIALEKDYKAEGAIVVHSIEEALEEIKKYKSEDVYVIGGASIYSQMLEYCDVAHITKIDYAYHADTYFPNLDENTNWVIKEESDERTYYDIEYAFYKYVKKK